jgi:hypothetical protein
MSRGVTPDGNVENWLRQPEAAAPPVLNNPEK